jgi:uncharacterized damage-inducible protein DinB
MTPDARSSIANVLKKALAWRDAHATFERAIDGLPADKRGERPANMPHSPWEIVEHIRIAQYDILDFCRNSRYSGMKWPDDYWPPTPAPPTSDAWDRSIAAYHRDLKALQDLADDPAVDLFATIPHGSGQTYLRELVLVIDHNAYHVGELVAIRQALGVWR